MASTFQLRVVTPDRKFFDAPVERVVVRTIQGDIAILKDMMYTVTPLGIGIIKIKQDGQIREAACSSGFLQVKGDNAVIIADAAEWPEEIDVERAERAKERAEKRLESRDANIDVARAQAALQRALGRLQVAQKKQ